MEPMVDQCYGWLEKTRALSHSPAVNEGDRFYGYYYHGPEVGERFQFYITSDDTHPTMFPTPFSTSKVVKIEDEFTFRTKNSVYKLITKEKMREINIDLIIN